MKITHVFRFLLFSALTVSCVEDAELHRSIFIRDKKYPDLPQYSEWGYNTFGAFVNNEVFVSGEYTDPANVYPEGQSITFSLSGEKRSIGKDTAQMVIYFVFPGYSRDEDHFFRSLNDSVFDLTDSYCQVFIETDYTRYPVDVSSGELHFIRVQNLIVDNYPEETILSGTFGFSGMMNGNEIYVSQGRFDVGVSSFLND